MIFRHLLVWATVWLSKVLAQSEPVLDRSIVLNKAWFLWSDELDRRLVGSSRTHLLGGYIQRFILTLKKHEWQVEFNLTEPLNNMKRFDISVSGTEPEDERRLFRFEFDAYYREVYKWFLRNGTKYIDGRCGAIECLLNQWNVTEIQNGIEPKFFGIMEGFLYPAVSKIFDVLTYII